jgi:hypothetical protein
MKISNLYLNGVKVKSEKIDFHDGAISVNNCDLSSVISFLTGQADIGTSFNVGFDIIDGSYYESPCLVSHIDESNISFTLITSGVIENKINELESKNDQTNA